jgi:cytochrome c biogenesis protein
MQPVIPGLKPSSSIPENISRHPSIENNVVMGALCSLTQGFLSCFRSVQLAIVLLSCLAIGILIGVFMPQEGLVETAKIKQQFGSQYTLLKAFGLFNVFSCPWFLALQVLFFFNLLIGSFKWLRPAWNAATKQVFYTADYMTGSPLRLPAIQTHLSQEAIQHHLVNSLKQHGYRALYLQGVQGGASKGNWSRLGPAVAHVGILLLLIFSLWGAFTGFKAQKTVVPGDSFTISQAETFTPNMEPPYWQGSVPGWKFKLQDFRIEYYADHPTTPKQ